MFGFGRYLYEFLGVLQRSLRYWYLRLILLKLM